MGQIRVLFPSQYSLFIIGSSEPTVEQRDYAWMKTDAITGIIQGIFTWSALYGLWLKPHWNANTVPSSERRAWIGSLTSLQSYDGGESATVSETTGPFWERDTNMDDKFPLGVGSTLGVVATAQNVFDDATPGAPQAYGVYWIKPTGRIYDRAN